MQVQACDRWKQPELLIMTSQLRVGHTPALRPHMTTQLTYKASQLTATVPSQSYQR